MDSLNFENTKIDRIVVHKVGNKAKEEGVKLSRRELNIEEDFIRELLMMYFTKPFDGKVEYNFTHAADLKLNEIYSYSKNIFNDVDSFYNQSVNIANHLYEQGTHPRIKSGELYVVYFSDCLVDDELCDGLGIFKSENKDKYLRVMQQGDSFEIDFEDGININKLDKGCIIFNTEEEQGYKVITADKLSTSQDAVFWKDEFLRLTARPDDFYMTKNFLQMVESFSTDCLSTENNVDKREQVNFRAKAAQYFEEKEEFVMEDFEKEVLQEPEIIETFKEYKESFQEAFHMNTDVADDFVIAPEVKKEVQKKFRSVIKLDGNFHIYIHANPELSEKGYDEKKKMAFYKLYYTEET